MTNKKKPLKNILLLLLLLVLLSFMLYIVVSSDMFNNDKTTSLEDTLIELYNTPEQRADDTYTNIISTSNLEGKIKVPNILRSFFINSKAEVYSIENSLLYKDGRLVIQWYISDFAKHDTNLNPYNVEQVFLKRQFKTFDNIEHDNYYEFVLKRENKGFDEISYLFVTKEKKEYLNSIKHNIIFPIKLSQPNLDNFNNIYPYDCKNSIDSNLYNIIKDFPCSKLCFIEENKAFNSESWEINLQVSDSVYNNIDSLIFVNNYIADEEVKDSVSRYVKKNGDITNIISLIKKEDNLIVFYLYSYK